ncbi:hypothetical protein COHA_009835 [Chlorella ohadii]|uniref:NodB homology domain-containing protein n=1 Tax=Chlorella ohadii TaxID=2649997 RepID=A0AAD5GXH5_9CHLO|nr:hypothetical protein COHA_009835 [Chlorella ohadii]
MATTTPLLAAAALLALLHPCAAAYFPVSTKSPVAAPPQFIVFTHDDDVAPASSKLVLRLSDSFYNPNGCKLPVTWFACTSSCSFSCSEAARLYLKGHEIAVHTKNHKDLRQLGKAEIKQEIVGGRDAIARCGIPKAALRGFRCPYLSDKPEVRQVLFENGFRYDSTIGAHGGNNRQFPATMDKGVPYNCDQAGQMCSKSERYPGMWQVPLYETSDHNLMDYCTNENTGAPRPGCSAFQALKEQFDDSYNGNRAPTQILIHTPYLQHKQYYNDVKKFLQYAMTKPGVWAVSMSQLLDWMENPVPAAAMPAFMAKYKCVL